MSKLAIEPSRGNAGVTIKNGLVLFWGGWPSNWEPSQFTIDGVEYNCVEQYMMAKKAQLFQDEEIYKKIMSSRYPKAQKEFGGKVRNYDDEKWSAVRYKVVLEATIEKYKQNPVLLERLLATGSAQFVEASPFDKIWGVGLTDDDPRILDPKKWNGQNLLGKAITEAREHIRQTT
jgi:ribA/ribD-fused uncharacterized protein